MGDFSFSRSEKLKGRKEVQNLFENPFFVKAYPFRLYYQIKEQPNNPPACFGISVPKKKFKRAHDRNLIKRYVRESYRHNKSELYSYLNEQGWSINIMVIVLMDELPTSPLVEEKLKNALKRLLITLKEHKKCSKEK